MGEVVLVCGPPCSGKTTWVQRRAAKGDRVVDYDTICREMGSPSDHDHPDGIRRAARHVRTLLEDRAAGQPGRTWVIRSLPDAAERRRAAQRLRASRVVVLDTPEVECRRRAEADGRPDWTSQVIASWWRQYTPDRAETAHSGLDRNDGPNPRTNDKEAAMADDDTTETVTEDPNEPAEGEDAAVGQTADDLEKIKAALKKANAEAARYRREAKANAEAAKRLQEAEDADKTEVQRLTDRVTTAEQRATQAEARALRAEVAQARGLTAAQAKRLVGTTLEELEADADELLAAFGAGKADTSADGKPDGGSDGKPDGKDAATPTRRPKERLRPGAAPDAEPGVDPAKLAKSILDSPF